MSRENPRHPANDPAFAARRRADPANGANNPDFIFDLLDAMEEDDGLREWVWQCFYDGDLSFLFHDVQLEVADLLDKTEAKEFLIFCSRQLGKSFFILCFAIAHCAKPHGRRRPLVRIFCETTKQVEDIVADNMMLILALAPPGWIKRAKSDNRWKVGIGEIRLCMIAAAHVDGKRGGNATLIICEEGSFSKSDQYKRAIGRVINPQLMRSQGRLVHVTTPSEDLSHYIHAAVLPKARRAGACASYTIYDNPQLTAEQIIEAFERCTDIEEWDREYLCKIVKSLATTVIPEFDEMRHVRAVALPSHAFWQTALDFGGVLDKHGLLLTFFDFERAKLCVKSERFLDKNTSTKTIKEAGLEMERQAELELEDLGAALWIMGHPRRVSDCAGQTLIDLRELGYVVRTPEKGDGSWEAGINALRVAVGAGQVEIDPSCEDLINTLEFGQYTKNRKDFERTDALGHLDLLAALIYAWRHRVTDNPFPANLGLHRERNYLRPAEALTALESAILPDFLRGDS